MKWRAQAASASFLFTVVSLAISFPTAAFPFTAVFTLVFLAVTVHGKWEPGVAVYALCAGEAAVVAAGTGGLVGGALLQVLLLCAVGLLIRPFRAWRDSIYLLVSLLVLVPVFAACTAFPHVWMAVPFLAGLLVLVLVVLAVYRRRLTLEMRGESG